MGSNTTDNTNAAENLARICLKRCGVERNINKIIAALEEQIFGNYTATNADTFVVIEDYQHMMYGGTTSAKLDIMRDGVVNNNIDCNFTDKELKWLTSLSVDGSFSVTTFRADNTGHDIKFTIDVPKSPTNLSSKRIRIIFYWRGVKLNSATGHIQVGAYNASESDVNKVLTLYLLS